MERERPFDFRIATREQILARAKWLEGRTLLDVQAAAAHLAGVSSRSTKGAVGATYEAYFGIPPNSRPEADFPSAGIELKSVPIEFVGGTARAKERVSLAMIDFAALPHEDWATAKVRGKLSDILFVFYEWRPGVPIGTFRTLQVQLWRPQADTWPFIEEDWRRVQGLVAAGRRSLLSEGTSRILGAATKGRGHQADPAAKSRAWSLRQPFVSSIYRDAARLVSVASMTGATGPKDFELRVIDALDRYRGWTLASIAERHGMPQSRAKNAAAMVVRRLLGLPPKGAAREFEQFGIEVKTVPVDPRGRPYEAMSFRAFRHDAIIADSWEDSDLLGHLGRMLIVPLERPRRRFPLLDATLGRAFFWSPTKDELDAIGAEWRMFVREIAAGHADRLPTAHETRYIHVRPKARDGRDLESAPGGVMVTRKSFWLNQDYVETVLRASLGN